MAAPQVGSGGINHGVIFDRQLVPVMVVISLGVIAIKPAGFAGECFCLGTCTCVMHWFPPDDFHS
jgi:hypothetical protein